MNVLDVRLVLGNRYMLWFVLQIGVSIKPQDDTPLSDMLGMNLEKHLDELNAISAQVIYLLLIIY